ncbi:MAG: hypothetical protein QOF61_1684 [Acidobacteriota bacterium]|jgi:hypothetical protein|nr:hypothetical protein [Acidobacteriota bacterium]
MITQPVRSAFFKLLCASATLCAATAAARADVKVRWRSTAEPGYEVTLYLKGSSQRRELKSTQPGGLNSAFVDDCARHQVIWLDPINRRYNVIDGGTPAAAFSAFNEPQFPPYDLPKMKGTFTETTAVTDTGERREMFGFTARHLKTVTTWTVAPDSCETGAARIETDGWYIDLLYGVDCSPDLSGATSRTLVDLAGNRCLGKRLMSDRYLFRRQYTGEGHFGFPLSETTRTYDSRGRVKTVTQEVFELSTGQLDDALFSVPAGYTRYEPRVRGKPSAISRALSIFR